MKAIRYRRYGSPDVLRLEEVDKPLLKDYQVLIKVHAASVNALDWHLMQGKPFLARLENGLRRPKDTRIGVDVAGRVEAIGSTVTQFQPGDVVFGRGVGTFAEYAVARETAVVVKPPSMTFEAAAAVPIAALTALQGLRDKGQIQAGERVLIYGAGGGVGTFAVQLAKAFGAEVTAVCGTANVDMVRSIGADHVIDYTHEDFTRNGQRYDLILAVNGYHPLSAYRRALRPKGRLIMAGASNDQLLKAMSQVMLFGPVMSKPGRRKMGTFICKPTQEDLAFVKELLESGKVTPVIDRCYQLGEASEALRYMEKGHIQGKIVITMDRIDNS